MSSVHLKMKNNIAWVEWDQPHSKVNVLSSKALLEFSQILDQIIQSKIQTACLISNKPSVFIAGADLKEIQRLKTKEDFSEKIQQAHSIFKKMENSSCTFIAAVHGACLGGGAELALACDYRIASLHPSTQIGFPEVNLGLIPGFGGCVRLSKWVGFLSALNLIAGGRPVSSRKAYKMRLADQTAPPLLLRESVIQFEKEIQQGKRPKKRSSNSMNSFVERCMEQSFLRRLAVFFVRKQILKKTKGFYPAPLEAVQLIHKTYARPLDKALKEEEKSFCQLAAADISRNLIRLFFMTEEVKKQTGFSKGKEKNVQPINHAGVIGAGVMGRGIAYVCAGRDLKVCLHDSREESLIQSQKEISLLFSKQIKRKKITAYEAKNKKACIRYSLEDSAFSSADIVIEAVVEDLSIKKNLIQKISQQLKESAVFATNTSSLSVTDMAQAHPRPSQFVGMHFFNPVHRMPLVEIIRGKDTSGETTARAFQLARKLGKFPVIVKDSPGFLVNRLLMPWLSEALWMWGGGMDIRSVDELFSKKFGFPMGPFRLMDEVGLDVCVKVIQSFQSSGLKLEAPAFAGDLAQEGCLGKKTSLGFYHYTEKGRPRGVHRELEDQRRSSLEERGRSLNSEVCLKRGLYRMINECVFVLEEKTAEAPQQVDLAMIMGAGFPPFYGGPLRYADREGLGSVLKDLERWCDQGLTRFKPAGMLVKLVSNGQSLYKE